MDQELGALLKFVLFLVCLSLVFYWFNTRESRLNQEILKKINHSKVEIIQIRNAINDMEKLIWDCNMEVNKLLRNKSSTIKQDIIDGLSLETSRYLTETQIEFQKDFCSRLNKELIELEAQLAKTKKFLGSQL